MTDRLFYACALAAVALIVGVALVWPQGEGARSPGPLGHPVVVTEASRQAEAKEAERRKAAAARKAGLTAPAPAAPQAVPAAKLPGSLRP